MKDLNLDKLLNNWKEDSQRDPYLTRKVILRIESLESEKDEDNLQSFTNWVFSFFSSPVYASLIICVCILIGLGSGAFLQKNTEINIHKAYCMLIDPVLRVDKLSKETNAVKFDRFLENDGDSLLRTLEWMESEFSLNKEQFNTIATLHKNYKNEFDAIVVSLKGIKSEYQGFEKQRKKGDEVDFLAFYDLLQEQKKLKALSLKTSGELVRKVMAVLTPTQQVIYQNVLGERYSSIIQSKIYPNNVNLWNV